MCNLGPRRPPLGGVISLRCLLFDANLGHLCDESLLDSLRIPSSHDLSILTPDAVKHSPPRFPEYHCIFHFDHKLHETRSILNMAEGTKAQERFALIQENLAEVMNPEIIEKILAEGRNPKIYWGKKHFN